MLGWRHSPAVAAESALPRPQCHAATGFSASGRCILHDMCDSTGGLVLGLEPDSSSLLYSLSLGPPLRFARALPVVAGASAALCWRCLPCRRRHRRRCYHRCAWRGLRANAADCSSDYLYRFSTSERASLRETEEGGRGRVATHRALWFVFRRHRWDAAGPLCHTHVSVCFFIFSCSIRHV
jgi:hypothetical protein